MNCARRSADGRAVRVRAPPVRAGDPPGSAAGRGNGRRKPPLVREVPAEYNQCLLLIVSARACGVGRDEHLVTAGANVIL